MNGQMRLFLNAVIKTKSGQTVRITALPNEPYVYGRVIATGVFVVVRCFDIAAILNSEQARLFV
jgi:hypothetical protein